MVSDITMEEAVFVQSEGGLLEGWSGDLAALRIWEDVDVRFEPEYEDDLVLALAWIKNIG